MLSFANGLDPNTSKYAFYTQNRLVSSTTEVPMFDSASLPFALLIVFRVTSLTDHPPQHSASRTHHEGECKLSSGTVQMAVDEKGNSQQDEKIGRTGKKTPEKAPGFGHFSGDDAGDETDKEVDGFDPQVYLCLGQVKFIQAEGKKEKEDGGEQVGSESGTDQNPKAGFSHS